MPATPLACRLDALDRDEQSRRAVLAEQVLGRAAEVRETACGYEARLPADASLAREVTDWMLLERRCCPFLAFTLEVAANQGDVWLDIHGEPGVKDFVAQTFGPA